jgi:hypothetical protein
MFESIRHMIINKTAFTVSISDYRHRHTDALLSAAFQFSLLQTAKIANLFNDKHKKVITSCNRCRCENEGGNSQRS